MSPKAAVPRKKSCNNCFKSKLRCDLRRPSCTRCSNRKWDCVYHYQSDPKVFAEAGYDGWTEYQPKSLDGPEESTIDELDFTGVRLICTVDAHRLRVRWLESLLPSIDQMPKPFRPATMAFVASIFKTYPGMFLTADRPPFIHWSQVTGRICLPLANCMNIARMWATRTAESSEMVRHIIEQEMLKVFENGSTNRPTPSSLLTVSLQRSQCSHLDLLASLQAHLLYATMLFAMQPPAQLMNPDLMIKLQDLAGDLVSKGTLCPAEAENTRPDWESWIVASAKRRTLFTATLFDNLVNFTSGSPSFAAVELAGLPAPAGKTLWNSKTRRSWNQAYNQQLSFWNDGQLLISDLWPQSEENSKVLQPRIDGWLSSTDEFGMMLYAVTAHTYDADHAH